MSDFSQFVPEHVRNLGGYTPGKSLRQAQRESHVNCIKMASNENPFGPSPKAVKAMQAVLAESNFYPDNDAIELRQKLADRHKVQPEQIVPTAGSTALLGIIARTLLSPGLNAITSERSFIVYPIATQAAGGRLIQVPMRGDGFDLERHRRGGRSAYPHHLHFQSEQSDRHAYSRAENSIAFSTRFRST